MEILQLRSLRVNATSIVTTAHWAARSFRLTSALMIFLPATSMVMAPHWGDHSLSVDLRIDEIPSTGGHRFFAHWQSSELRLVQDDTF